MTGTPTRAGRLREELRRFLVMFVYLWAILSLFVLNETVILRQRGIDFSSQGFALINALVLAKVMLGAEYLKLRKYAPRRPLVYPILLEAGLITVLFIAVHVAEHVAIGLFHGKTVGASVPAIGGGGIMGLAAVAAILFVTMIPFFAFRAIGRELGYDRLNAMLFGFCDGPSPTADKVTSLEAGGR